MKLVPPASSCELFCELRAAPRPRVGSMEELNEFVNENGGIDVSGSYERPDYSAQLFGVYAASQLAALTSCVLQAVSSVTP